MLVVVTAAVCMQQTVMACRVTVEEERHMAQAIHSHKVRLLQAPAVVPEAAAITEVIRQ